MAYDQRWASQLRIAVAINKKIKHATFESISVFDTFWQAKNTTERS
jgi:hypothetical protein